MLFYGSDDALCESYDPAPSAECFNGDDDVGSLLSSLSANRHDQRLGQHLQKSASTFIEYTAASAATRIPVNKHDAVFFAGVLYS